MKGINHLQNLEYLDFFNNNPIKSFNNSGYFKYRPGFTWDRDYPHDSFYIVSNGSLHFKLKDTEFTAEKNDVVFLKASDNAVITNNSQTHSDLYFIAFETADDFNLNLSMIYKDTNHIKLFKDINDAYLSKEPLSSLKISHLFIKLIYSLASEELYSSTQYQQHSKIHKAAKYINVHYYKDIKIEDLCEMTGYSPAHLRRLFIKIFGISPNNYILDRKIEMAKELLLEPPEKTIDEIAEMLGLCSSSYFCRLFKNKTGLSPMEYKKTNR
jgi:AraC-like DNA-binding protein